MQKVIVVVNKTRLEQLIERFNTRDQARFYIEHAGGNFLEYQAEHDEFYRSRDIISEIIVKHSQLKVIEKKFLPNFIFSETEVVVALGQDGLVANTAKYIKGLPLLGVNPDLQRNDGVLLPFTLQNFENGLINVIANNYRIRPVTMALATTNDGQSLTAFNDLFIGPASHTSARYQINFGKQSEEQSSSGLIISTGAGSTGWLSSVMNMSNAISTTFHGSKGGSKLQMGWDDERLVFVVREPFKSRHSQIALTAGMITKDQKLNIESHMPFNGVIFSDGVESDFIQFNSGCQVEITVSNQKARLVAI